MREITTRCVACRSEFTDDEVRGANACPRCGSEGVPSDPRQDKTIVINPHELRVLTIWASNWASTPGMSDSNRRSLKGILSALRKQLPDTPLTIMEDLREVADTGLTVQLLQGNEVVTIPGRKLQ